MNGSGRSTPKQKRQRLLIAAVIIVSMFLIRYILVQRGVIRKAGSLPEDALLSSMKKTEVRVGEYGGTILQTSSSRKNPDLFYVITQDSAIGGSDSVSITSDSFSDPVAGKTVSEDDALDIAVVSAQAEGAQSCWFSEDLLYQKKAGTPVYFLTADGNLGSASYTGRDMTVEGYDRTMLTAENASGTPVPGGGVYDGTGRYLGTVMEIRGKTLICVPGSAVVDYFRTNH